MDGKIYHKLREFPSKKIIVGMLQIYYDGSGKSNDRCCKAITLVGLASSLSVWGNFKSLWGEILEKYGLPSFHMSEAMSLKREFSNWDKHKRDRLVIELLNVFGRLRPAENKILQSNLTAASCTVIMDDYRKAKKEIPGLRTPEAMCVQICFNRFPCDIDLEGFESRRPNIELFFDGNEEFMQTIYRVWQNYKYRKDAGWPKQIQRMDAVRSTDTLPIQAADLLAWIINKYYRGETSLYALGLPILVDLHHVLCDYKEITMRFSDG